jgi:hypothetical protein
MDFGCIPPSPFPSLSWGVCFVQRVVSPSCQGESSRVKQTCFCRQGQSNPHIHLLPLLLLLLLYFVILPARLENNLSTAAPVFVAGSPQQQHPA